MKKYFYCIFLMLVVLLFSMNEGFTQSFQDKIPQVKPIPPDAAALFKVLERPIGTFTGTVPVSFPLCEIGSGPLKASLSLNYNSTGGIRVEELASSVGLGFSLNDGGGRITQIVRGLPDDHTNGLLTNPKTPSNFNCFDMYDLYASSLPYELDLEPDIFMYSFNGQSGKFFFKEDKSIVMMENTGIKIEYDTTSTPGNGIRQWIITDEQGNKYYFGKNKAGTTNYYIPNIYQYQSMNNPSTSDGISSYSWFLTEAYDMNEVNKLTYTYVSSGDMFTTFSGGFMILYKLAFECGGFHIIPDEAVVNTSAGEYLISRIEDNKGNYLQINSSGDREDGYSRKVNSIYVYNPDNSLKKRIVFNYDYFNDWSSDPFVKRLKLKDFATLGASGNDSLVYRFHYDESHNMPSRLSSKVDFWGFYNGQANLSFYPNVVFKTGSGFVIRRTNGSNRNAYASYAKANILTRITYPTGGYREFEYEGNTALTRFNINEYHPDPAYTQNQYFTETNFSHAPPQVPSLKRTFTVNSTDGGAAFKYWLNDIGFSCNDYRVKIFKTPNPGDLFGGFEVHSFLNQPQGEYSLVNGYYRLEVYKDEFCTLGSIDCSWDECTQSTTTIATPYGTYNANNRNVGGVRVKEIRDYDPVSGKINKTAYRYKLYSTDSTYTSGLLISQVKIVSLQHPSEVECRYYQLSPSSSYPLASEGGSYVVYPEVRTIENGNGWIDHFYSYAEDILPTTFPYVPPIDNSSFRGRLRAENIYDNHGNLLKKTTHSYVGLPTNISIQQSQQGLKVKPYWFRAFHTPSWYEYDYGQGILPILGACNSYGIRGYPYALSQTIDSTFDQAGVHVQKTNYTYDHSYKDRLFLKQVKTRVNNADKEMDYKYPFDPTLDFTFGLSGAEQTIKGDLLDRHYIQPLEVLNTLKPDGGSAKITGGQKYSLAYDASNLFLSKARSYTSLTDYTELNFSEYDDKGNLQEKYKTDDVKEVYLWGYNGNYPVAKVVGSNYTTVNGWITQSILDNPANDEALRNHLNIIRTNLSGTDAQVTTYTYQPGVGISSITDPKGYTSYYEYDVFGRLLHIKDADGNVLKAYEYNYGQ
ncbi:RHS repeat domain-containing protein [Seonamhaeicola sp.]|uniref:RHS repeat domain-containing protein n=1 Tax=Seonamhaeicola sp. TaxID=1912245 RepID=UPI00262A8E42|nr:RHS repeat domain-containing protein [Seonamhaeicola sp.]